MFRHAVLYVVGNLVAPFAFGEVALHVVEIILKQVAGVLIDGIERAKEVYVDVLFHRRFRFLRVIGLVVS